VGGLAVEKAGHVPVFLSFGDTQLAQAGFGHHLAQQAIHAAPSLMPRSGSS
jgi:hypothetical protein